MRTTSKYLILVIIIILDYHGKLLSQEFKRNNNWVTGFAPVVKFEFEPAFHIDTFPTAYFTRCSSTISDTLGVYQFYCTGFYMMDKQGDIMQNGNNINNPKGSVLSTYYGGSSLFDQTSIILPKKGNTYYVFSTGMSDSVANNYLNHIKTEFDVLNYSVVDMDSNGGKGKVTIKNKILLENQHYHYTSMTAVKHGNGKDWWLVKADCLNNRYQLFIVKEDTILGPYFQNISSPGDFCTSFSQIYFSDDGTKLASSIYGNIDNSSGTPFYYWNRVDLYDFDRCNGEITYRKNNIVPYDLSSYPDPDFKHGICFSPNGKLLYMSNRFTIYQIDLEDTNTYNSILISGPDTIDTYFARYSTMACGPDGKLYIGNSNGTRPFMSYIDKPNIKGLGCEFKANGLWQPYTNLLSPPNMPNYGLGKAPIGGNCWPDLVQKIDDKDDVVFIYPNPANDMLHVQISRPANSELQLALYNQLGQRVAVWKEILDSKQEVQVNLPSLATGLYTLDIICDGEEYVRKLVVE